MTISKAQWDADGDNLRLSMPFSKVDKERRIVSGFATLDNVDKQNDIVTTDASLKAFNKFRGNIREMHEPIAVGKMVSFKEDKYFDPQSKKFYTGVYVSAYVSKGAQATWEKVMDGTLSGFSIGGKMNKWDDGYDEKADKQIRIIKDYDLVELSLVDNPANQFANIMSIEKVDGVDVVKGDITDVDIENVFWDDENGIVTVSKEESANSPITGTPMKNIGFVETNDSEKSEMIKFLVDSAKGINLSKMTKEEDPMTDATENVVEKTDDVVEEAQVAPEADAVAEDVAKADEAEAEKSENMDEEEMEEKSEHAMDEDEEAKKSEDMDEDEEEKSYDDKEKSYKDKKSDSADPAEEVSKADDVTDLVSDLKDNITSAFSDLSAVVKSLNDEIAELKKSLTAVNANVDSVKNDVTATKSDLNELGKNVDAVVADTAFRKSGDLGEIVQEDQIEKSDQSLWGGRFLKTADLFR
jgi:hypothetical protein